jgi:hypothetical protein
MVEKGSSREVPGGLVTGSNGHSSPSSVPIVRSTARLDPLYLKLRRK